MRINILKTILEYKSFFLIYTSEIFSYTSEIFSANSESLSLHNMALRGRSFLILMNSKFVVSLLKLRYLIAPTLFYKCFIALMHLESNKYPIMGHLLITCQ